MSIALTPLHSFAHRHDELPAFHAAYLIFTLLAAAMLNLGVFALLIAVHMSFDIVKYREVHNYGWIRTIRATAMESLVDVTLLMVALVFSVYLHHSVGLVSISGLLRAELTIVRMVGTLVPKFVILEHLLKVFAHMQHYLERTHPEAQGALTTAHKCYISFIVICALLLTFAGRLMNVESEVVHTILLWELTPWNV